MRDDRDKPYKLKMNLMIKNLLMTAMGTCKFVMHHKSHQLSQAIEHFELIDLSHIDALFSSVKNTNPGRVLTLTFDDQLLIYTALDLTCKTYMTDLGDKLAAMNLDALEKTKANFSDIRSTVLKGCEFVMEGMRENLIGIDEFDERQEILDQYVKG